MGSSQRCVLTNDFCYGLQTAAKNLTTSQDFTPQRGLGFPRHAGATTASDLNQHAFFPDGNSKEASWMACQVVCDFGRLRNLSSLVSLESIWCFLSTSPPREVPKIPREAWPRSCWSPGVGRFYRVPPCRWRPVLTFCKICCCRRALASIQLLVWRVAISVLRRRSKRWLAGLSGGWDPLAAGNLRRVSGQRWRVQCWAVSIPSKRYGSTYTSNPRPNRRC